MTTKDEEYDLPSFNINDESKVKEFKDNPDGSKFPVADFSFYENGTISDVKFLDSADEYNSQTLNDLIKKLIPKISRNRTEDNNNGLNIKTRTDRKKKTLIEEEKPKQYQTFKGSKFSKSVERDFEDDKLTDIRTKSDIHLQSTPEEDEQTFGASDFYFKSESNIISYKESLPDFISRPSLSVTMAVENGCFFACRHLSSTISSPIEYDASLLNESGNRFIPPDPTTKHGRHLGYSISADKTFRHINNCKYNNIYECQIKKYNYETKAFEICGCGIKNIKRNIENHFKLCAFIKYKCIFCIENIAQKDLEEHVKNKCRLRIIYYPNGNKYFGEMKNNIKDGYGTLYYKNGEIYEGEWKNDVREGYGIFYSPLGIVEGEWKNNDLEGFGIKYYEEGRYEGEYKKSYEIGYGIKYDINDKILYEGEFNHSKYNGYGVEYLMHSKYEGEFVNNKKEGYGTLYNDYFGRFEGEFKEDFMEGYGSAFYINGDKYKGYFKNGIEGGYGIMFFSDGYKLGINYDNKSVIGFGMLYNSNNKLIYKGEYQGKYFQHGYGIFYYECGCRYEGEFKKDLIEGYGVLYSEKGYIYEGEYKDGRLQGYGIIYNKNKEIIYKGQFKEDLKEGYGKLYNSNGYRYEGEWKNDLEDGFGILYYPNGNRYEGKFKVHSINGIRKLYSPLGIEYTKDT